MWSVTVCDTVTGEPVERVPVSAFRWERLLSAGATGSATLHPSDYTLLQLRDLTSQWERTWVLEWDTEPVFAGIVTNRPYAIGKNAVEVQLTDLWGLLGRRLAIDHNAPNSEKWKVTYTGTSLRTLAKRAIQRATTGPAVPPISLPIGLEADVAGAISRTYYGYHNEYTADVLRDLMDEGLDIDFDPQWVSGRLQWVMRTGAPLVGAAQREWSVSSQKGGVTDFSETSDGMRMTNNSRILGEGSEQDMLVRSNRNLASSLPLLDAVVSKKNVSSVSQLANLADANNTQFYHPTIQWNFSVPASGDDEGLQSIAVLRVGDQARLLFDKNLWITDGPHDRRIVRLAGSLNNTIEVGVQPTGGA